MDKIVSLLTGLFTEPPAYYLSWPAAAMIVGTAVGILAPKAAARLAVDPRTQGGFVGILTAPFVHLSLSHLAANLPPFLVLGALVLRHDESRFLEVALAIAIGQGVLLWVFGRNAAHAGMSGVIFGFFGYLLALAVITHTTTELLVGGAALLFYGGMLAGLAPTRKGISWEGHLLGIISGISTAWFQNQAV